MAKKTVKKKKKATKKTIKNEVSAKSKVNASSEPVIDIKRRENRQLVWFFVIVIVVFSAFLVPYFVGESRKSFQFHSIEWSTEKLGDLDLFRGRFPALNPQIHLDNKRVVHHNIYLRNDPRENIVPVDGMLDNFKFAGYVSISPAFDTCRGGIPRVMVDLFSFLTNGVGMYEVSVATTDAEVSNQTDRPLIDCSLNKSRTVLVLDMGDEAKIVQSVENPNCYQVTIQSCQDIQVIEKFMVQTVHDFVQTHGRLVESSSSS